MRQTYSTDAVAPADRLTFWNHISSRAISPMSIDVIGPAPFRAELTHLSLGGFDLYSPRSTPAVVWHDGQVRSRANASTGKGRYLVMLQCKGCSVVSQAGCEESLGADDFFLLDPATSYQISFDEPTDVILAGLSDDRRTAGASVLPALIGAVGRGGSGGGALLAGFLRSVWDNLGAGSDQTEGLELGDALRSLVLFAYGASDGIDADGTRTAARRQWVHDFVDANLGDPELGAATIAREMGVTPRSVQMLFAAEGTTPSGFIRETRLQRAAELLADPSISVTMAAFSLGFGDLSYFSRAFRARFGASPSAYRRLALQTWN